MVTQRTQPPARGSSGRVVDALRTGVELTRADLAQGTGLSHATVSALVRDLERAGLVTLAPIETGPLPAGSRAGRRPEVVRLTRRAGLVLGVHVGSERVRVAIGDLAGRVLAVRGAAVRAEEDLDDALEVAARLAGLVRAETEADPGEVVGCGVAVPAPVDRATGRIASDALLPAWAERGLGTAFEDALGLPVLVDDDAHLGALAEQATGAARGVEDALCVAVSSGVGAGPISGGRLVRGARGLAGQLGHVTVDPGGRLCRCGRRGCLETIASVPAVRRRAREATGRDLPREDLAHALRPGGDPRLAAILPDAGRALGGAIAAACRLLDPAVVVVGGDAAFATERVLEAIRAEVARGTLPGAGGEIRVVAATQGERGPVVGALRLAARPQHGRVAAASAAG